MTAEQLTEQLNNVYGIDKEWPKSIEVDPETYGYVCQAIFNSKAKNGDVYRLGSLNFAHDWREYRISIGTKHNGIMFKNIELVLTSKTQNM